MWPNPRIPFQMSSERARLEPLDGKPLMVNAVVNIEYWPFDRAMPRGILPAPHGAQVEPPDLPNYSWVEYGMRCGMPRLFDMLGQRGIKASAFLNAQCADVYPSLAKATVDAGWELVGHGWFQRSLKQVEDEEAEIARCLARLEQLSGKKVRGWFGAGGGESMRHARHPQALRGRVHARLAGRRPAVLDDDGARAAALPALHLGAQRRADLGGAGPVQRRAV